MKATKHLKKTNAARQLDELGLPYQIIKIEMDESDLSAETAASRLGVSEDLVYKTLVAKGDQNGVIEVCLPAGRQLDLKALAAASANKNVSLVTVKELTALTGYQRGGCSPLGGKKFFPVYILNEKTNDDEIYINAGGRGLMLLIKYGDLLKATGATPAAVARRAN